MPTQAAKADKYDLYIKAVQDPEAEVHFYNRVYRKTFGRKPMVLREDFCATAAVCCQWVRSHRERSAIGVDLDPAPLAWARKHHLPELKKRQRERVTFLQADVRDVKGEKADVVAAGNFSYYIFRTRDDLRTYFRAAYNNLAEQGLFVTDMVGGPDCQKEEEETRTVKEGGQTFTYVWEQKRFDPITNHCTYYISFRFRDGSAIKRAFRYDWRLWSVPEVREVMLEAGFSAADVYWEGTDEDGEGDGVYRKRKHAPADMTWVAYVVGVKSK